MRFIKCPVYNCVKGERHRAGYANTIEHYPCSYCKNGKITVRQWMATQFRNWIERNAYK